MDSDSNRPKVRILIDPVELREISGGNNLLQSGFWGAHKERFGWTAHGFHARTEEVPAVLFDLLVLTRPLVAGKLIAYVPHGPEVLPGNAFTSRPRFLESLADAIGRSTGRGVLFIRYDLPAPVFVGESAPEKAAFGPALAGTVEGGRRSRLRAASVDVQPPSTVIVDVDRDDDVILAQMKSKTRYNVRLAAKKGVEVVRLDADGLPSWYELYRKTAERDRIAIHSMEYYEALFELAISFPGTVPDVRLYMARHEGDDLAGIITAFHGGRATYLYGASSNQKRNLMPAYLLQWTAMRAARDAGCTEYDLFGIPPEKDQNHAMAGLYQFKTGFGGRIVHRPGCWDIPVRPVLYRAYRAAESVRSYYFHTIRKRTGR